MDKMYKKGIIASTWDLFHAGHVLVLKEAKELCDYVVAALQTDPTVERPYKHKPIQTLEERRIQLEGCKYIDEIVIYTTEDDLGKIIMANNFDIRFKGSDHISKIGPYDHLTKIYYHNRENHDYSSSSLRKRIYTAELEERIKNENKTHN